MIKCNCCGRENSNYAIYCEGCGSLLSTVSDSTDVKTEVDTSSIDTEPAYQESEPVSESAYEPVQTGPVESGNYSMPPEYSYNPNPARPSGMEYDGICITGFICALSGLFCCGLPALAGLILCIIGLVRTGSNGKKGRDLALAGIIISIVMMIITVIILIAGNGNSFYYSTNYRR